MELDCESETVHVNSPRGIGLFILRGSGDLAKIVRDATSKPLFGLVKEWSKFKSFINKLWDDIERGFTVELINKLWFLRILIISNG